MRRVLFAMLVSLMAPLALLTQPSLTPVAVAVGEARPPAPTPAQRHARLVTDYASRAIAADARLHRVSVAGLRNEWEHVALCEVGGNWRMIGPVYSGIGFRNATWNEYGGGLFARLAGLASENEQIVIGMRVTQGWVPDQYGCDPGGW